MRKFLRIAAVIVLALMLVVLFLFDWALGSAIEAANKMRTSAARSSRWSKKEPEPEPDEAPEVVEPKIESNEQGERKE